MSDYPSELEERYRFISQLGSGNMGVVYHAHDKNLAISVAIKMLPSGVDAAKSIVRFQREARACAKLNNENIVRVLDFDVLAGDKPYLVMEYLEGVNLRDLIVEGFDFGSLELLKISSQIARGMDHAHKKGIIHRDLKSSNILINDTDPDDLQAKVIDFGIAHLKTKDKGFESTGGNIIGSPGYMSPEAVIGEKLDGRSDIYSMGCVLYEMFTGHLPFQSDNFFELINMHKQEMPEPIVDRLTVDVPREIGVAVDATILKCLEKSPERRPPTMAVLADQFDDLSSQLVEMEELKRKEVEKQTEKPKQIFNLSFSTESSRNKLKVKIVLPVVALLLVVSLLGVIAYYYMQYTDSLKVDQNMSDEFKNHDDSGAMGTFFQNTVGPVIDKEYRKENVTDEDIISGKFKSNYQSINLQHSKVTDRGIRYLKPYQRVRKINLADTDITDIAVKDLSRFKKLYEINLDHTKITDRALQYLGKRKFLVHLSLKGTSITDQGLKELENLQHLTYLSLAQCKNITKTGITYLKRLPKLHKLNISRTNLNLEDIEDLTNLSLLTYEYKNLSGRDVDILFRLKKLKHLTLTGATFEKGDILRLAKLPEIEIVNVLGVKGVSKEDIAKFRQLRDDVLVQDTLPYKKNLPKNYSFKRDGVAQPIKELTIDPDKLPSTYLEDK